MKERGRRPTTAAEQRGTLPWHLTRKFKVFSEMFSKTMEPLVDLNLNYINIFFPLDECKSQHGNGNYSQLFLLLKFWLKHVNGKPKMGYVLTANDNKAECPLAPSRPTLQPDVF